MFIHFPYAFSKKCHLNLFGFTYQILIILLLSSLTYKLFALSLPTEMITIFIDDVFLRYFDIFKYLWVWVCVRKPWVANYSLLLHDSGFLASITRSLSFDISPVQQLSPAVDWPPL